MNCHVTSDTTVMSRELDFVRFEIDPIRLHPANVLSTICPVTVRDTLIVPFADAGDLQGPLVSAGAGELYGADARQLH